MRNRIIYQNESIYTSPAPATGYHWMDWPSTTLNDDGPIANNVNLVQSLPRVQTFSYDIDTNRLNVQALGLDKPVDLSTIIHPEVSLQFSYLQMGVLNESRLGLYVNYTRITTTDGRLDQPHYINNTGVNILSGFITRTLERPDNTLDWPYSYRDSRNIFLAIETEGVDLLNTSYETLHPRHATMKVIGFGNCHMTSYTAEAAVGNFPIATVAFNGYNVETYDGGNNLTVPALMQDRTQSPRVFSIPDAYNGNEVLSVVRPGDITVSITGLTKRTNFDAIKGTGVDTAPIATHPPNLNYDVTDLKIQSYSVNMDLARVDLKDVNYSHKRIVDRQLEFPVPVSVSFQSIPGDPEAGSLSNILSQDHDYNITIKLAMPTGVGTAVQYDFLRAKYITHDSSLGIGDSKTINHSFVTHISSGDFAQGFFMSGRLNIPGVGGADFGTNPYLLEDGEFHT